MARWWQRLWRGYADEDMAMLRLKISSGIGPEAAKKTWWENNALIAMPRSEILELCGVRDG